MFVHNHNNHMFHGGAGTSIQVVFATIAVAVFLLYVMAVFVSFRKQHWKKFDLLRVMLFILGVIYSTFAVVGPLVEHAHINFTIHMMGHLLLGMLGPLLMVLGAPMTFILRALPVLLARRLTKLLNSWPIGFVSHPIVASFLNIGGLWVLYMTPLYAWMHDYPLLYLLIHIHVFLAGYVFTSAIIYIDPTPHRYSFVFRAMVLVCSLAGHGILSKSLYAHPPIGVSQSDAESGAMLMYYGGDLIDLGLIVIFCYQWYKATRPRFIKHDRTGEIVKMD
jgi:putative membrane protein